MQISLNFLPFEDENISFKIYRKPYCGEPRKEGFFRAKLPIAAENIVDKYEQYYISLSQFNNSEPYIFCINQNPILMTSIIWHLFKNKIVSQYRGKYEIIDHFQKFVSFVAEEFEEGNRVVKVSPYYLPIKKMVGYLFNFDFRKNPGIKYDKKIQLLSFSIDRNGKSNANSYLDRLNFMKKFLNTKFIEMLQLSIDGIEYKLYSEFVKLESKELSDRIYIFNNGKTDRNKTRGIKNKPFKLPCKEPFYVFIFKENEKEVGNELFKALIGRTYQSTFPGMKEQFNIDLTTQNVSSINIDLTKDSLEDLEYKLKAKLINHQNKQVIGVFVDSYSDFYSKSPVYIKVKYVFSNLRIPLQVVRKNRILASEGLKWAASGIGLQIFSKLGGIPWIVKPSTSDCLIFGIGTAHEKEKTINDQGITRYKVKKFYAYSICLDSTGRYLSLGILGENNDNQKYITTIKNNIKAYITECIGLGKDISNCVIHTPFKMRYDEIQAIKDSLDDIRKNYHNIKFSVIKINTKNRFFGFAENNLKIPYESSYIKLSNKEYLIWFEGLIHGKEYINKRVANPTHIEFLYYSDEEDKERLLQDIVNLAGASWRGFNAKLEPTSIFYPELIARFIRDYRSIGKDFEQHMSKLDIPWFL